MKCAECGAAEHRINGYCSCECERVAEARVEERDRIRALNVGGMTVGEILDLAAEGAAKAGRLRREREDERLAYRTRAP